MNGGFLASSLSSPLTIAGGQRQRHYRTRRGLNPTVGANQNGDLLLAERKIELSCLYVT